MTAPSATSVWTATAKLPSYSPLTGDVSADVCVVGAGISGLTTAYLLTESGKSVVVLDDGAIGSGMTGVTTAHLVNALDDRFFELERFHGEQRQPAGRREPHRGDRSHRAHRRRASSIACDFTRVDGYLFCAPEHDEAYLDRELAAIHRAGLHDVAKSGRAPLAFDTGVVPALSEPGAVSPAEISRRLSPRRSSAAAAGSTPARTPPGSTAARTRASTTRGRHRAGDRHVVVATNTPVNDLRRRAHQAGAVHDLRDRRARAARFGAAGALLGHRRSVPLRARASGDRCRARSADRRRRRSQDRAGGRHRAAPSAPRSVGARSTSRRCSTSRTAGRGR